MTASRQRTVALALSALVFAMPVLFVLLIPHPLEQPFGVDFTLYRDVTIRWLGGGPYFEPYQLAGPYQISAGDVLYPPVALWLFVPFARAALADRRASCGGRCRSSPSPSPCGGSSRGRRRGR